MQLARLHQKDGNTVYVNREKVTALIQMRKALGTSVYLSGNFYVEVKEEIDEVALLLSTSIHTIGGSR